MQASPSSSESRRPCGALALALALAFTALAGGCATVRPEDKEFLAEPAMTFANSGIVMRQEGHVLDNREGSTGGTKTQGGGCGCN